MCFNCVVCGTSFNSIKSTLFSTLVTQHIVYTTGFFPHDVLKRERAEDRAYVGSFPVIILNMIYTGIITNWRSQQSQS